MRWCFRSKYPHTHTHTPWNPPIDTIRVPNTSQCPLHYWPHLVRHWSRDNGDRQTTRCAILIMFLSRWFFIWFWISCEWLTARIPVCSPHWRADRARSAWGRGPGWRRKRCARPRTSYQSHRWYRFPYKRFNNKKLTSKFKKEKKKK